MTQLSLILEYPQVVDYINLVVSAVVIGLLAIQNLTVGKAFAEMRVEMRDMEARIRKDFAQTVEPLREKVTKINERLEALRNEHDKNHRAD